MLFLPIQLTFLGETIKPKCTLEGSTISITVDGRSYCYVDKGRMTYYDGRAACESLDAKLPLPKSEAESLAFGMLGGNFYYLDLTDPSKSGKNWIDSEGQQLGDRYVNVRVMNDNFLVLIQSSSKLNVDRV